MDCAASNPGVDAAVKKTKVKSEVPTETVDAPQNDLDSDDTCPVSSIRASIGEKVSLIRNEGVVKEEVVALVLPQILPTTFALNTKRKKREPKTDVKEMSALSKGNIKRSKRESKMMCESQVAGIEPCVSIKHIKSNPMMVGKNESVIGNTSAFKSELHGNDCRDKANGDPRRKVRGGSKKEVAARRASKATHAFDAFSTRKPKKKAPTHFCPTCSKAFTTLQGMQVHKRRHELTELELKKVMCEYCSFRTETLTSLRKHHMRHTGLVKRFMCDICKKWFMGKGALRVHMELHMRERSYRCETCGKTYITRMHLLEHMLIHGEKTNVCRLCNRRFFRKSQLKSHMNTHSQEARFECVECQPSSWFMYKCGLKHHFMKFHYKKKNTRKRKIAKGTPKMPVIN